MICCLYSFEIPEGRPIYPSRYFSVGPDKRKVSERSKTNVFGLHF
jgi:hypothetical protein